MFVRVRLRIDQILWEIALFTTELNNFNIIFGIEKHIRTIINKTHIKTIYFNGKSENFYVGKSVNK